MLLRCFLGFLSRARFPVLLVVAMLSLLGCSSLPETNNPSTKKYIFPGDPGIYNLNEVVLAAELFKNAPVATFTYVRTEQFETLNLAKLLRRRVRELESKQNQYVSAVAFTELKGSTSEKNPLGEFLLGIDDFMRGPYAPERVGYVSYSDAFSRCGRLVHDDLSSAA